MACYQITTNPPWVFLVLGITAGWLMALHHLRLELIGLDFCQADYLSLFQLYFLSPLQFFSVFRPFFVFVCAQRDRYRLGLVWEPDVGVCCWWALSEPGNSHHLKVGLVWVQIPKPKGHFFSLLKYYVKCMCNASRSVLS